MSGLPLTSTLVLWNLENYITFSQSKLWLLWVPNRTSDMKSQLLVCGQVPHCGGERAGWQACVRAQGHLWQPGARQPVSTEHKKRKHLATSPVSGQHCCASVVCVPWSEWVTSVSEWPVTSEGRGEKGYHPAAPQRWVTSLQQLDTRSSCPTQFNPCMLIFFYPAWRF